MNAYQNTLNKVIKIREDRQKLYGDDWIYDPIEYDFWMLYGKFNRLQYLLKHKLNDKSQYEKIDDTLIDMINYSIFLLYKINKKGDKL